MNGCCLSLSTLTHTYTYALQDVWRLPCPPSMGLTEHLICEPCGCPGNPVSFVCAVIVPHLSCFFSIEVLQRKRERVVHAFTHTHARTHARTHSLTHTQVVVPGGGGTWVMTASSKGHCELKDTSHILTHARMHSLTHKHRW